MFIFLIQVNFPFMIIYLVVLKAVISDKKVLNTDNKPPVTKQLLLMQSKYHFLISGKNL